MKRAPISEEMKDSIKYMRLRVEIKHKNQELVQLDVQSKQNEKQIEYEQLKNEKAPIDFSNYMFDNVTGKATDIKSDYKLAAMVEKAKKGNYGKEMVERAEVLIRDETINTPVRPQDLPVKTLGKKNNSNAGISFTDEELENI